MAETSTSETGSSSTVFVLWGILLIVAGLFLVARPGITAIVWIEIMAIAFIIGGIFDVVRSIANRGRYWGLKLVLSLLLIIVGVYIIGNPVVSTIFSVQMAFIFFAVAALVNGIFNMVAGFRAEDGIHWGAVMVGLMQIIAGVWLLMNPVTGMMLFVPVFGIVLIVGGIFSIIACFVVGKGSDPLADSPKDGTAQQVETTRETPSA